MVIEVLVPDIGDYKNVEVIEIMVKEGDLIKVESDLMTVETDKAAMTIPAPSAGKISKLLLKVGDKVSAGDKILELAEQEDTAVVNETTTVASSVPVNDKKTETVAGELITVLLPDLGDNEKATIIDLHMKIGDEVHLDQTMLTLESAKASMDVPITHAGIIKELLVKLGDKVGTGDKVLVIETIGTSPNSKQVVLSDSSAVTTISNSKSAPIAPVITNTATSVNLDSNIRSHAGPGVRKYARELGVDLSKVTGTGRKSRIITTDINNFVKSILTAQTNTVSSNNNNSVGLNLAPWPEVDFAKYGNITTQPLSRIKKLSGSFLQRNWVTIPHVTHFDEADITEMEDFRQAQSEIAKTKGVKLTPLVFLMKAAVAALREFPIFNSSLSADGNSLVMKQYFHIGVAVDTPNGLVVPVVRDVDQKGLFELADDLAKISQKAREGKLTAQEMQGGCFSISSLGGIGGTNFTPIINAPEVAILGVAKSRLQPVYKDGTFVPALMLPLALSYDHRVVDGADAARFTAFLSKQLSDIRRLLL